MFDEFLDLPGQMNRLFEMKKLRTVPVRKDGKIVGYKKARWETNPKTHESSSDTNKRVRGKKKNQSRMSDSQKKLNKMRRDKISKTIADWAQVAENVLGYVNYREVGPVLEESQSVSDNKGNVVRLKVPNMKLRNEAKLLSFNWKTLNTDVIVKRNAAKNLHEDQNFVVACSELRRCNALSDNNALSESLDKIVTNWPSVLYLTQEELAECIKACLDMSGDTNFDDQTCEFMAEGILRTAHDAYVDRVAKITKLAGATVSENSEDVYEEFSKIVNEFYTHLDENTQLEMQAFDDLYEALRGVIAIAEEERNREVFEETANHLDNLLAIIEGESSPSLTVAENAASWLYDLIETNLGGMPWSVSNNTHISINGDHPELAKKANHGYTPSSDFSGDWGDAAPASDGQSYKSGHAKEMRDNAWGNIGGNDTYPSLSNPYVPSSYGDYKIKGEKHIDSDSDQIAHRGGSDTWPNLQNPYVPNAENSQSYKMNQGKEQDLVVDK